MDSLLDHVLRPWTAFFSPASDLHWLFLLSAAGIALIIYRTRALGPPTPRAFLRWAFPRAIYGHPSAAMDLAIFVINSAALTIPSAAIALAAGGWVREALAATLGTAPPVLSPSVGLSMLFTLVLVICGDLALYASHRAMHASAILWEFHKVHHSAPVLMPLTAYRQHPVEEVLTGMANGLAVGAASGVFLYLLGQVSVIELAGHNAIEFAAVAAARHLRHSHVAVGFGLLERCLVSPAMHQLHHSTAPEHLDKNFGTIFSLWDRLWGSFHAPAATALRFGLKDGGEEQFLSLTGVYVSPFIAAARTTYTKVLRL